MRIYAIVDEYNKEAAVMAWLMVRRNPTTFSIEISRKADPKELPMILDSMVEQGIYTVGDDWSRTWVQQRIVPPERQNIGRILRDNGLQEYDEADLLVLGHGRCAQDDFCIREIRKEDLPEEIRAREGSRIRDLAVLRDGSLLLTFRDGAVKRCAADRLAEYDRRIRMLLERYTKRGIAASPGCEEHTKCGIAASPGYEEYTKDLQDDCDYREVSVVPGGAELRWGTGVTASAQSLRGMGESLELDADDLRCIISGMTVNTAQAAEQMNCSRQNVNDLVKRGRLTPVRTDERNMLFLKSDIDELRS